MSWKTILSAIKKNRRAVFLVQCDFGSMKKYYSTGPITMDGEAAFTPSVLSDIPISTTFSLSGMRSSDSQVGITVANDERLQDLEEKVRINSGDTQVFVWTDSLSWSDIEDYPIFSGSFVKSGHDKDEYSFSSLDWANSKTRTIISMSATTGNPGALLDRILLSYFNLDVDSVDSEATGFMSELWSNIEFSTSIDARVSSIDLVDRILSQCCCGRRIWHGKLGPIIYDLDAEPTGRLTDTDILGRGATFYPTPHNLITNDVYATYNYSSGSMSDSFTVDYTNDSKCKRSYRDYGPSNQVSLQLGDCSTAHAARWCVDRFLEFRSYPHTIVELKVPIWIGLGKDEGVVNYLTLEDAPGGWTNEPCILLDRTIRTSGVDQRWMRIGTD